MRDSPGIHPVIYYGVNHGVRHRQPIERQVHMLDVSASGDGIVVVGVDEVTVIRQPAEGEYRYDYYKHSNYLEGRVNCVSC